MSVAWVLPPGFPVCDPPGDIVPSPFGRGFRVREISISITPMLDKEKY
jgi:hypothetical protein